MNPSTMKSSEGPVKSTGDTAATRINGHSALATAALDGAVGVPRIEDEPTKSATSYPTSQEPQTLANPEPSPGSSTAVKGPLNGLSASLQEPSQPVTSPLYDSEKSADLRSVPESTRGVLELADGTSFYGWSFGAETTSVSGECVFQTGMVGYTESLTDPSYEGQILILTYPLIGNYGVPSRDSAFNGPQLPDFFESSRIHVKALIVGYYSHNYSHHLAQSGLGAWLKENKVPALYGIDTRALTKKIRVNGSMLAKVLAKRPQAAPLAPKQNLIRSWDQDYLDVDWIDPNALNLVASVSLQSPKIYRPDAKVALRAKDGSHIRVLVVDVGMKYNQIRCFLLRGVELKIVPWDYDFVNEAEPYHGLFISNGPGDPTTVSLTVKRLRQAIDRARTPIFGICLGHQLLALAAGAKTMKMKFGNRGANIPCTNLLSGRCYITSQNHGYAVDVNSLNGQAGWKELFVNANDASNEGIYNEKYPFFSVQFHPESTPGPRDTEFLFDVFIKCVVDSDQIGQLAPILMPGGTREENMLRAPLVKVNKVLVLGSGGLSIGQAGEFDYSGSQAIKALREEGIYTILINPNIATIQTSKGLADKVYFLPVNADFVRKVILHEKPDGIYCTFGGQTALQVGIQLKDEFATLGVKVLGTPIETIITTEDRELFAQSMAQIGEKCAESASATNLKDACQAGQLIGYPVIIRAAFALGGLGSGFASSEEELVNLCNKAFAISPQVLIEKSMKGWKEIEYEVVRDAQNNCITVCNMENFDPLGIHTGDSIVVAPSQTLSDQDYNMLRTTAVNVIRHLGVVGECNIQYALNPFSKEYCIIEVNARLSRSSALASKATGYPLAFIAAKLGLGIALNDIKNSVTKLTSACFEPSLDYVVVKIPRWDLKKFTRVSTALSSSMKSVGEVMAIGRTFEESIQKAIRSIDYNFAGFGTNDFTVDSELDEELEVPSDKRLFAIANAMHNGYSVDKIWQKTKIDKWFLSKLMGIIHLEKLLSKRNAHSLDIDLMRWSKQLGFSDKQVARCIGSNELAVRRLRQEYGVLPFVKQIDTVAAEFPAYTNYLYMTYNAVEHDVNFDDHGVMVLGSGVYRIGSSVEFDWCAVRAIRTCRQRGIKTVMVNYNPETVSTDYDEADRLYFENINLETVLDIYEMERSSGVIISMGGQTPNNIALPLHRQNVKILGTSPEMIDTAENRYKFSRMLDKLGVDQPLWKELTSFEEAAIFCDKVSYPVLVRPSYVLSGAAMNVVYSPDDLRAYLTQATAVSREYPVVISKFIEEAKEIEMDAVARDGKMVMHFISEHVENAGVHSGDATLIQPPQDLDPETVRRIEAATEKIANALNVTGPFNLQFIAKNNEIKVIECNVRAARSFPFVSKVTGIDAIQMATEVMLGFPVISYPKHTMPERYVGIKVPQFSFSRLSGADPIVGVEMASTGEVACFGSDKFEAYIKAMLATGFKAPQKNILLSIGSFKEKLEMLPSCRKLHMQGYSLFATAGTADFMQEHNIPVRYLESLEEAEAKGQKSEYSLTQHLANNLIDLYINLPSKNRYRRPATYMSQGYRTRRMAIDYAIPLVTNVKCAKLLIEALVRNPKLEISSLDYQTSHKTVVLPGLIGIGTFIPGIADARSTDALELTRAALASGLTMLHVLPLGLRGSLDNTMALHSARKSLQNSAHIDYALSCAATPNNASELSGLAAETSSLFIPFRTMSVSNINKVGAVTAHFSSWPTNAPVISDAQGTDLASMLLLASLHSRSIHITNVGTRDDIALISMSKEKGLNVTCDVAIFSLFFNRERFSGSSCLPTLVDQKALWDNLDVIDCLSMGSTPYELAHSLGHAQDPRVGMEEGLVLLLDAVADGSMLLEDIIEKMYTNPRRIFGLPEQTQTQIEIDIDRRRRFEGVSHWSPLKGETLAGVVHRVVLRGQTVYLDGAYFSDPSSGQDIVPSLVSVGPSSKSAPAPSAPAPHVRRASRASMSGTGRPQVAPPLSSAILASQMRSPTLDAIDEANGSASILTALTSSPSAMTNLAPPPTISLKMPKSRFYRRHILSVKHFDRNDLHLLFNVAHEMRTQVERNGSIDILRGKILCTLFFEASTRTSSSFEAAMNRLGGKVVSVAGDRSSTTKGESLGDTIRTLACYGDAIVLRHPTVGSAQNAAKFSPIPIINAGDGIGEHPTQSLLDVYCIREELGTVNGLTITLVGDLKNGRTVHSLVRLLAYYSITINYVSPESLSMPEGIVAELAALGVAQNRHSRVEDVIARTDVLYVTRIQQERFKDATEYESVKNSYIINNNTLSQAKSHMIVMHPLPRNDEIDPEVDFDGRAAYFRQMRYGLFVRM